MIKPETSLKKGDGLLVIDVQNDFCPGGALPIEEGDRVVAAINPWIAAARERSLPIYLSRDWHPAGHPSFRTSGGLWPGHCIQNSSGAEFHPSLRVPEEAVIVTKGVRFDQNQLSAFDQTGLAARLRADGVERLWVAGLALDVCVLETVLDARREGFEVCVLLEACRAVSPEGGAKARAKMCQAGAKLVP
jgi:nicotinamidase/pyrazinamidase